MAMTTPNLVEFPGEPTLSGRERGAAGARPVAA